MMGDPGETDDSEPTSSLSWQTKIGSSARAFIVSVVMSCGRLRCTGEEVEKGQELESESAEFVITRCEVGTSKEGRSKFSKV